MSKTQSKYQQTKSQAQNMGQAEFDQLVKELRANRDHMTKQTSHAISNMNAGFDDMKQYATQTAVATAKNVNENTDQRSAELGDLIQREHEQTRKSIGGVASTGFKIFVGILIALALAACIYVVWRYTHDPGLKINVVDLATQSITDTKVDIKAIAGWCGLIVGVSTIIAGIVRLFSKN